jgi:hypothetical protein
MKSAMGRSCASAIEIYDLIGSAFVQLHVLCGFTITILLNFVLLHFFFFFLWYVQTKPTDKIRATV